MGHEEQPLFVLVGLTSSGKKKVGIETARLLNAEILSLDSMKVYRGMDIGTAKPSPHDRSRAVFHMLDLVEPDESFSVGRFLETAKAKVGEVHGRERRVLFLGGTAFYLKCLLNGLFDGPPADPAYREELLAFEAERGSLTLHGLLRGADPESAGEIHPNDTKRVIRALEVIQATGRRFSWHKANRTERIIANPLVLAGLRWDLSELEKRIRHRTAAMIRRGLKEEVSRIVEGPGFGPESGKAIGYVEMIQHLNGDLTLDEAEETINRSTLRFVKKQETWYRRFPEIRWFDLGSESQPEEVASEVARYFMGTGGV